MTPQEFKEKYIDEDGWVETGGDVALIVAGDSVAEYKHVYTTNIYSVGKEYFAVDFTCDNSGYWSDGGENYPPEVRKVVPELVTKTDWVDVIENS